MLETNLILAMSNKTLLLALEYGVYHVLLETNLILAMSSKTLLLAIEYGVYPVSFVMSALFLIKIPYSSV